jgi:hypothetical protein
MIYGTDDTNAIDKAVRLVIMLIMVVFDPLAVLLLIAANMSMKKPEETQPVKKTWNEFFKKEPVPDDMVEVEKENIATVEENVELDSQKKKRGFPNRKNKLETKYDYDAELAFREKESK